MALPLITMLGAGYLANEGLSLVNQFMEGGRQERLGKATLDLERAKVTSMSTAQKNLYKALMGENRRQEAQMIALRDSDRANAKDNILLSALMQKFMQPDMAPMMMAQAIGNFGNNMPQMQPPPLPPTSLTSMLRM